MAGNNTTNGNNKKWTNKKFNYAPAAEILKHAGLLKIDLRKEPTKYQKQKIRDLYRENDGALFRMARFREEAKQRRRLEKLADINGGAKLTPELVKHKVGTMLLNNVGLLNKKQVNDLNKLYGLPKDTKLTPTLIKEKLGIELSDNIKKLNKKQLGELNNLYNKNRKSINNNPNNYGLRGFTRKKVSAKNAKIMAKNGWVIKGKYAYLPTLSYKTKGFKKDLFMYEFPNGQSFPAIVEHNYKRLGGKEFTYFIMAGVEELVKLIENLTLSGKTNIYPDLMYTSGSRARENINAQRVSDVKEFMHYVANVANDKTAEKEGTADSLISSIRIESDKKPKIKY